MTKKIIGSLIMAALVGAGTAIIKNHIRSVHNMETLTSIAENVSSLALSMEKLTMQNQALIIQSTFRTDPWSGTMMEAFQDGWVDWVRGQDREFVTSDMPDVRAIQREFTEELIPTEYYEFFQSIVD